MFFQENKIAPMDDEDGRSRVSKLRLARGGREGGKKMGGRKRRARKEGSGSKSCNPRDDVARWQTSASTSSRKKRHRRHLITTLIALRPEKPPPPPLPAILPSPGGGDRVPNVPRKATPRLRINRPSLSPPRQTRLNIFLCSPPFQAVSSPIRTNARTRGTSTNFSSGQRFNHPFFSLLFSFVSSPAFFECGRLKTKRERERGKREERMWREIRGFFKF